MFESAEAAPTVDAERFAELEPPLRAALLAAQFRARDAGVPVIVVIAGVEGAGKGAVVDRLAEWFDVRGVDVRAFWDETDEERERPAWWRFWRVLPPRGAMAILFGSWYTRPIIDHVHGRTDPADFARALERIVASERMLAADGAVLVKLWFHLDAERQRRRLASDARARGDDPDALIAEFADRHEDYVRASTQALRTTDRSWAPWTVIGARSARHRDLRAGETVLDALRAPELRLPPPVTASAEPVPDALGAVDLSASVDREYYRVRRRELQARLHELAWRARRERRDVVAVFEGWDAAGKGGAIRRLTQAMDARLYRTISVAAPTDEERAQHWLWRFWRHLPMRGRMTLYDRSWYGRVLVERVEGFAREEEWRRAYGEIREFEGQLVEHGIVLMKFWLHLSPEEQLSRFRDRQRTPWKAHKITDEDWRNRARWSAYGDAVNEMVARTHTADAPWTLVAAESKRHARITVLETFCDRLEAALDA